MQSFTNITTFNNQFANQRIKLSLNDYFTKVHDSFYKTVDTSFMNYFMELCASEDEFIIHHSKLEEYGVINTSDSNKILVALKQYNLMQDTDYILLTKVSEQDAIANQHGGSNKTEYMLTQQAFKLCLMRAKNTLTYAKYYILLEKIFNHFNNYEKEYTNILLTSKDNKIDECLTEIKDMKSKIINQNDSLTDLKIINKGQSQEIRELLGYAKSADTKLDIANDSLDIANIKIDTLNGTVTQLVINLSNFSNFSPLTDQSLKITKMLYFIVFNNDDSDYVEIHCMYYSMENTAIRMKIKNNKYNKNGDKTSIMILGSTNPISDSMTCIQQLQTLKDEVIEDLNLNENDIKLFEGVDRQKRIMRVVNDKAQAVVDQFILLINKQRELDEVSKLEKTTENNIIIDAFYNASHFMSNWIINRFKTNNNGKFDLLTEYKASLDAQRDTIINKFNDDHKDIQVTLNST